MSLQNQSTNQEGGLYEEAVGSVIRGITENENDSLSKDNISENELHKELSKIVVREISDVLSKINPDEVSFLINEILTAEKIFVIGVGRVFLALQCLAKRLAHFGFDVNVVGSVVEKSITNKDLLLVASGSGESRLPVQISKIAKQYNARVGLITSAKESTLKSIADVVVHLPCPTKTDYDYGVKSIQSMSTLFDQCLHIFGDILCLMLQKKTGQTNEDIKKRHANLE